MTRVRGTLKARESLVHCDKASWLRALDVRWRVTPRLSKRRAILGDLGDQLPRRRMGSESENCRVHGENVLGEVGERYEDSRRTVQSRSSVVTQRSARTSVDGATGPSRLRRRRR
jgi:hypothetical protein